MKYLKKREPWIILLGMRVSTNIIENSMEVLQKFKTKRIAI
jgi:hypothetical protein